MALGEQCDIFKSFELLIQAVGNHQVCFNGIRFCDVNYLNFRNPVVSNTLMVNNSNGPLITSFKGNSYLIPGNSSFILADVYDSVRHLVIGKL